MPGRPAHYLGENEDGPMTPGEAKTETTSTTNHLSEARRRKRLHELYYSYGVGAWGCAL